MNERAEALADYVGKLREELAKKSQELDSAQKALADLAASSADTRAALMEEIERLKGPMTCQHDPSNAGGACGLCHASALLQVRAYGNYLTDILTEMNERQLVDADGGSCGQWIQEIEGLLERYAGNRICPDMFAPCKTPGCQQHLGVPDKRNQTACIDCGKPVSSGNICLPCIRVRYPSEKR
jgi:hypothetical protein